ncbi:hypothetical protein ACTFIR_011795 [Dictyostelium discoideum]
MAFLHENFSIIKIKESIINDYFKLNLFLDEITINDFKEIKKKFVNNQLVYNRIIVNIDDNYDDDREDIFFTIHKYLSNENSKIISNLFKILELNNDFFLDEIYSPNSEEEEGQGNKKCTEIHLKNLSISGYDWSVGDYEETLKVFKIFKGKNITFDGSDCIRSISTHVNYSVLFDPDNSGQQVESIKVQSKHGNDEFVEPLHLSKVNQFENLHSITIPIDSLQILSNFSDGEMQLYEFYRNMPDPGSSEDIKSELNQMINSLITSKSLKNLNLTSPEKLTYNPTDFEDFAHYETGGFEFFANKINEIIESYSNSFKPLFSELNTSIKRIEFDCRGLLNINTFSNLLNNKSIKYLYLYGESDFIVYYSRPIDDCESDFIVYSKQNRQTKLHKELISINQYLFDNIFSSPLTSIIHYKIRIKESNQLKLIFNLILNNIFKLQLYSLIFEFNRNELVGELFKEFKILINNISIQQEQQEQQISNDINLKEFKIKIKHGDEYIEKLGNLNNPYFTTY